MITINSRTGHEILTQEEFEKKHPGLAAALNAPRPYQEQGEELRRLRQAVDMSVREMAKALGMKASEASDIETGRVKATEEQEKAWRLAAQLCTEAKCDHASPDGSCCGACADQAQSAEEE